MTIIPEKWAAQKRYREKHPDKVKANKLKCRENNPERHKELVKAQNKRTWLKNSDRYKQKNKEWREANKEHIAAKNAERRAKLIQATPLYDSDFTTFVFTEAKKLAKLREAITGFDWHVDHIIPLKSNFVCGLHYWNNLQVIPAKINLEKGNSL